MCSNFRHNRTNNKDFFGRTVPLNKNRLIFILQHDWRKTKVVFSGNRLVQQSHELDKAQQTQPTNRLKWGSNCNVLFFITFLVAFICYLCSEKSIKKFSVQKKNRPEMLMSPSNFSLFLLKL